MVVPEGSTKLLDDFPRGRDAQFVGTLPHSYFESPQNLAATKSLQFDTHLNRESKLFMGVVGGEVIQGDRLADGRLTRHIVGGTGIGIGDDRHHILLAGSRAGKGRSMLLPCLLSLPPTTSSLWLDPKGDLARISIRYRSSIQQVGLLDPFGVAGSEAAKHRVVLNPIATLDPNNRRTFVPNSKLISDSIIVSGDFKDKHWDTCSHQALSMLILHVATYWRYDGCRDLITVWHLAAELASADPDNSGRYWLEQELLSNDAANGAIRNLARQFYDRTGGEFSSVLSNLRKHLDFLSIECMADCLTGDSIDLRDLKRGAMSLYISVPAMRMTDLSGWLRMIVQLTLAAHEEEISQLGSQTILGLDEMHVLGTLKCLEVAAAQIAGLGLKIVAVLQDLSQLKTHYPKNWETFIANAAAIQAFGLADETTLEYISKRLGEAPTISRSTNAPGFEQATKQAATGESWSLGVHRLMNAEEVGRFFARDDKLLRQLVIRPGYRPMVLQRAFYDQHEFFRGRFDER
ncbi:type IV secretory system conjugative DNA transfer family protein [Thalassoglobus sp.]|uniref:type IV secretory system conjugative DNA transfer family protein n=1 Tax=Thalassoglobus sp. TaxID=2795869 RepID=UPI003AA94FE6